MKLGTVRSRARPDISMAPLIDVIFLLLIFYAVTTQFVTDERLKLKLPEAKTAEDAGTGREEMPPVVIVAADGTVWIDDVIVPESELEGRIQQIVDGAPEGTRQLRIAFANLDATGIDTLYTRLSALDL